MRTLLILALAGVAVAAPLAAQRRGQVPARPPLPAEADSNDASAYYDLGLRNVRPNPRVAADAFYWASQLDPASAETLYGRWATLHMANPRRMMEYWNGERRVVRNPDVQAVDSLYYRALIIDPLLYRRFEGEMFSLYLNTMVRQGLNRSQGGNEVTDLEVERYTRLMMQDASPYLRAQEAYGQGRHQVAIGLYEQALAEARRKSGIRIERAQLLAHVGNHAEAAAEFAVALRELRAEDERDVVYFYRSKALMEHSLGTLYEHMGQADSARAAYGRALEEDLAFYPAHVRLGRMALAAGDTAGGLAELDLAASSAAAEPAVLYAYAVTLAQTGRMDDAATHLARVHEAAPFYAEPYFVMGVVREQQGNVQGAVESYRTFLGRAPRAHRRRAAAEARLQALDAAATPAPTGGR